jgi:glucose-1-phosphate cytidylyltransferase
MKVVLFCGGLGTRLREHSDVVPKPLVNVGVRPLIWHLMRYYAHYGHCEFILALGYRGEMIRDYFLNYEEAASNDFTLTGYGSNRSIELHRRDFDDWKITFVDTGLHSNIGQRLLRVRKYLGDDEVFLANYSDGLSDVPLDQVIEKFHAERALALMVSVRSSQSFHVVRSDNDGVVTGIGTLQDDAFWINGGFFVLHREIFDYINEGEELVGKPFARLIANKRLVTYRYPGFWQAMDTFKDKITFDRMEAQGQCPWMFWRKD